MAPIIASTVVAFPLMYRTMRGAFEQFDTTLIWSARTRAQQFLYLLADHIAQQPLFHDRGTVLAFARASANSARQSCWRQSPGKEDDALGRVYAAMAAGDDALAYKYVLITDHFFAVLLVVNLVTNEKPGRRRRSAPAAKGGV